MGPSRLGWPAGQNRSASRGPSTVEGDPLHAATRSHPPKIVAAHYGLKVLLELASLADERDDIARGPHVLWRRLHRDDHSPPVRLMADNSPSRAPGFPGNEREIGAQNLRNLAAPGGGDWWPGSAGLGASALRTRAPARIPDAGARQRRGEASDGEGPLSPQLKIAVKW